METPETKWGREFVTSCYSEDPAISWQRITEKMRSGFQNAGDKEIIKMLGIKYPGAESKPVRPEKEKKTPKPRIIRPQELPWPENLMTEIGLKKVFPETGKYAALTEDQMDGLAYVMGMLKEKEQTVIRLRYEQHQTLKATGEPLGVSGNRVRQVAALAVRKLTHPSRLCYFRDGYQGTLDAQERLREETRQALKSGDRMRILGAMHIYDAHLSVRSTNCLVRAGYKTLGDVIKAMEEDPVSITQVRNLGRNSLREVVEKLEEYSVDCSEVRKICDLSAETPLEHLKRIAAEYDRKHS